MVFVDFPMLFRGKRIQFVKAVDVVLGINPRHFLQLLIPIGQQRLYLGFCFVAARRP